MDQKVVIKLPINKTYFTTFLNSFINIYFLNQTEFTLDSLKNLLFPPEHPDKEFNELVEFIIFVFDEIIKNNKDKEILVNELNNKYSFDEDVLDVILNVVNTKRTHIVNHLNIKFYDENKIYKNLHWEIKSVLASNKEDYIAERYSDLEFHFSNSNDLNNDNLGHINITYTKNDFEKMLNELKRIKQNLKKINSIYIK